jgi:hypothetical protein
MIFSRVKGAPVVSNYELHDILLAEGFVVVELSGKEYRILVTTLALHDRAIASLAIPRTLLIIRVAFRSFFYLLFFKQIFEILIFVFIDRPHFEKDLRSNDEVLSVKFSRS